MANADLFSLEQSEAQKFGIPLDILAPIILAESGGDPNKVGDKGTSFGLLQLHQGGQLGNLTPQQAMDPYTNLETGLPPIAAAYHKYINDAYSQQGIKDILEESGHPGQESDTTFYGPGGYWSDFKQYWSEADHGVTDLKSVSSGNQASVNISPTGFGIPNPGDIGNGILGKVFDFAKHLPIIGGWLGAEQSLTDQTHRFIALLGLAIILIIILFATKKNSNVDVKNIIPQGPAGSTTTKGGTEGGEAGLAEEAAIAA